MLTSLRPRYLILAAILAGLWFLGLVIFVLPSQSLSAATSLGPPLRVGNRVYLLTGQWQRYRVFRWRDSSELIVDISAYDAATMEQVFQRRLEAVPNDSRDRRSLLGVQHQTLWVLLPSGPHALDRRNGNLLAVPEELAARNPSLRGLLPSEARYYSLSATGLALQAADGRTWHLHPDTLQASPEAPAGVSPAIAPAFFTPQATYLFQQRGFVLGKKWLGLLNAQEAQRLARTPQFPPLDQQTRRSLYAADFISDTEGYSNFQALTNDYLAPGLLVQPRPAGPGALVYRRDPDSVFILHRDFLGDNGLLTLDRVSGPQGKVLWSQPLPLSVLQSVLPGEESLVCFGRLYARGGSMQNSREMLLAVDWKTGAVRVKQSEEGED